MDAVKVRSLGSKFVALSDENGGYEIQMGLARAGVAPVLDFERERFQESAEKSV